jgi:hypothetical protein
MWNSLILKKAENEKNSSVEVFSCERFKTNNYNVMGVRRRKQRMRVKVEHLTVKRRLCNLLLEAVHPVAYIEFVTNLGQISMCYEL